MSQINSTNEECNRCKGPTEPLFGTLTICRSCEGEGKVTEPAKQLEYEIEDTMEIDLSEFDFSGVDSCD